MAAVPRRQHRLSQSLRRVRTQLALHIGQHRVGVGRRDRNGHPEEDAPQELPGLCAHEGRDNGSVEGGDVEGQESTEDEEQGVEGEEGRLLGARRGDDNAEDSCQSLEEHGVDLGAQQRESAPSLLISVSTRGDDQRTSTRGALFLFLPPLPPLSIPLPAFSSTTGATSLPAAGAPPAAAAFLGLRLGLSPRYVDPTT
jgi:hypothetical protein